MKKRKLLANNLLSCETYFTSSHLKILGERTSVSVETKKHQTYYGGVHGDLRCCGVDVFLMR